MTISSFKNMFLKYPYVASKTYVAEVVKKKRNKETAAIEGSTLSSKNCLH